MGTITYAALLVVLFITGTFIFTYFESAQRTVKRGLRNLDRNVKRLGNIKVLTLNKKNNKSLTVGMSENTKPSQTNNSDAMRIYVHEY